MRQTILTLAAFFLGLGLFAQEKEIDDAVTALQFNNYAEAKAKLAEVQDVMKTHTLSPELMAKYCYAAGMTALGDNRPLDAAQYFSQIAEYETGTMYSIRNKDNKETEYYKTKEAAERVAAGGNYARAKEITLKENYLPQIEEKLNQRAKMLINKADGALKNDQPLQAAEYLMEISYLVKPMGGDSDMFLYNAALNYHKGEKFQKAFDLYKQLIDKGYTGESVSWTGIAAEGGEELTFESVEAAQLQKNLGVIKSFKEVKSPSVEHDLYKYTLFALNDLKKFDPVVETIEAKYPDDSEMLALIGSIYHNSGNDQIFLDKLQKSLDANPNDATSLYNVGVILMNQDKDAEALSYFEKAIKVKPDYKNAYTNAALCIVKPEKAYIGIINANLGSSPAEKKLYKENMEKRKALYIQAVPYLKKAFELDPTNYDAAKNLRQAYQNAEMYDDEDRMRAIEKSLQR